MKWIILNAFRDRPVPVSVNYTSREQNLPQCATDLSLYDLLQRSKISTNTEPRNVSDRTVCPISLPGHAH